MKHLLLLTALLVCLTGCQQPEKEEFKPVSGIVITAEIASAAMDRATEQDRNYIECLDEVCREEMARRNKEAFQLFTKEELESHEVWWDGINWRRGGWDD